MAQHVLILLDDNNTEAMIEKTKAHNEKGELVAEFIFTWSIKGR